MNTTIAATPAITPMRPSQSAAVACPTPAPVRPARTCRRARRASTQAATEHGSVKMNSDPKESSSSARPAIPSTSAQTATALRSRGPAGLCLTKVGPDGSGG
jgi:hypothetical protein